MFAFKNSYYLYIENTKILNLNLIKKRGKFSIIYRDRGNQNSISEVKSFRDKCKCKSIKFFVANDFQLFKKIRADGLYLSSYNNSLKVLNYKILKIGSAHNIKEIKTKLTQGCEKIVFSRLFKTDYERKKTYLGLVRFNLITYLYSKELVPLGGIRLQNLNKQLKINSDSFVLMSEIKKKPAIISRLF